MYFPIKTMVLFYCTWFFLLFNFLIAKFQGYGILLITLRDFWVVILVCYLLLKKKSIEFFLLVYIGILGIVSFLGGDYLLSDLKMFFYGYRDFFLIILVAVFLTDTQATKHQIKMVTVFIWLCSVVALLQFSIDEAKGLSIVDNFFSLATYYDNKGVDINLSNGLIGDRISLPLYSPNLLGGMIILYLVFSPLRLFSVRGAGFLFVSVLTMVKTIPVALIVWISRKYFVMLFFMFMLAMPFVYYATRWLFYYFEGNMLVQYHFASVLGHFHAFEISLKKMSDGFLPVLLGSNSIAASVEIGGTGEAGIESTLLARLSELKLFFLPLIFYIYYINKKLGLDSKKRTFLFLFLFLILFSATNNHPVMYLPALIVLSSK